MAYPAPVVAWAADEGTGTTVADYSGNGHTGNVQGAVAWVAGHPPHTYATQGEAGNAPAIWLEGVSLFSGSKTATLMCWVKAVSYTGTGDLIEIRSTLDDSTTAFTIFRPSKTTLQTEVHDSNGTNTDTAPVTVTTTGVWNHIAAVLSETSLVLYVNGTQVASQPVAGTGDLGDVKYFYAGGTNTKYNQGAVNDVRLFDVALSAADVAHFMDTPANGVPEGSGTGSYGFAGAASGSRASHGAATGAVAFAGVASGSTAMHGTSSGSLDYEGSASGRLSPRGAAADAVVFEGSASGSEDPAGTASGDMAWSGTASGHAPSLTESHGHATGSYAFDGAASGSTQRHGSASGVFTYEGGAAGHLDTHGAAHGDLAYVGTASGHAPSVGVPHGDGVGVYQYVGAAAGATDMHGAASGVFAYAGSAHGRSSSAPAFPPVRTLTGTPIALTLTGTPVEHTLAGTPQPHTLKGRVP